MKRNSFTRISIKLYSEKIFMVYIFITNKILIYYILSCEAQLTRIHHVSKIASFKEVKTLSFIFSPESHLFFFPKLDYSFSERVRIQP